jgi:nucleoside-diphosphate-sugar epimerase
MHIPTSEESKLMRVAIAGGHGQIGSHLVRLLVARGDEVVSLDRNPGYAEEIRDWGAIPVTCDLESASEEEVAAAIEGSDAVVFAAGAGPGSGPERKWTMDYGGAVKLIAAAEQAGISRYVIVSSIGADPEAAGDDTFSVYLRAKGKADAELQRSGLGHTVIRPGPLTDEPGTGLVRAGDVPRGAIPREDVAAVVAATLETPSTIGATFVLTAGDQPIADALAAL